MRAGVDPLLAVSVGVMLPKSRACRPASSERGIEGGSTTGNVGGGDALVCPGNKVDSSSGKGARMVVEQQMPWRWIPCLRCKRR